MDLGKRCAAEAIGTFWLVFGGCAAAALSGGSIGWLGVGLAFGLTLLTMAYTIGTISGCHLNPAVSLGLAAGGRFPFKELPAYAIAQLVGGILGAGLLFLIASHTPVFSSGMQALTNVSNGYGIHSPRGYPMKAALVVEAVLTMMFLFVILGTTHKNAPSGFAPLAIGLMLTGIHCVAIPVTNCSVNPTRSLATAIFAESWALSQLWVFIVAPLVGGLVGGLLFAWLSCDKKA